MADLLIRKSGYYTSVQDQGRRGYRKFGVPVSGCMDLQSATLANLIVGNDADSALLEFTLTGPELLFTEPAIICITGGDFEIKIDEQPVWMNRVIQILSGQRLCICRSRQGARGYLAIKGGIESEQILGSSSMYFPITPAATLADGQTLQYHSHHAADHFTSVKPEPSLFQNESLQARRGPEFDLLSGMMQAALLKHPFIIGSNNRMGYQLKGAMPAHDLQITTSQVAPGTIQLTPSGMLLALMRDAQVTGGYPRVLQLSATSINQLAQKTTGMQVHFHLI